MGKARVFKYAAITTTAGILIIIVIGVLMVYRGDVKLPTLPMSLAELDVSADKVSYVHTDGEEKKWTLEADKALYDRNSQKALLKSVRVIFYDHGKEVLVLTANEGELEADHNLMTVRGEVIARSAPNTILRTQSLIYEGKTNLVTTPDPVDLETAQARVKGVGMTLDLDTQRMQIHRSIQYWMMGT